MIGNTNLGQSETNIKLPISFILFGLGSFITAQTIFFFYSSLLTDGMFRTPEILMGTHFLLLGWIVMVIMGAMYQLVPVAFLTPIWNERLGFLQFGVTGIGIITFSYLLGNDISNAVYGASIVVVGILLFLFQMGMTLFKQKQKNTMTAFVTAALLAFLLTIIAGLLLAWTIAYGSGINYHAVFYSHMLLGVAGWFTLIIFGFSYKLVLMFSLSHGFSNKWTKSAFITYVIGLIGIIISFFFEIKELETIGWLLLFAGFTFFGLDIIEILSKRIKKKLDRPFTLSLISIGYGWLIHLTAVILKLFSVTNQTVWGWLIFLYIICWVMFSILGYLYKIVPFLWWTHKYSAHVGKSNVPLLKDMVAEKLGIGLFISFTISTTGLVLSGFMHWNAVVIAFQGLILLTSIYYVYSIIRVLFK